MKIANTITTIRIKMSLNNETICRTMLLTPEHRSLQPLLPHLGLYGDALTKSGNDNIRMI